jgi:hypothetical protein
MKPSRCSVSVPRHNLLLSPGTVPDGVINHARMRYSAFAGNAEQSL